MRVQHNITAMNAYRNYTNNTSALASNLEKLSSGYKINRAGDDAAGLAISEKMRAQITGLEVAQKNAKDGISLVQTAEGALTEVHDMLNRMYELAEQSANGTYDDDVDRAQLQKELDSLRTEINRISQATNFNGIQLLDGSLDGESGDVIENFTELDIPKWVTGNQEEAVAAGITIHYEAGAATAAKTSFAVEFNNATVGSGETSVSFKLGGKDVYTDSAGTTALSLTVGDSDDVKAGATASDIVTAFVTKSSGKAYIDGQEFDVSADGDRLVFTQTNNPTSASEVVDGYMTVEMKGIAGTGGSGSTTSSSGSSTTTVTGTSSNTSTQTGITFTPASGVDSTALDALNNATITATASGSTITFSGSSGVTIASIQLGGTETAASASGDDSIVFSGAASGSDTVTLTLSDGTNTLGTLSFTYNMKDTVGGEVITLAATASAASGTGAAAGSTAPADPNAATTVITQGAVAGGGRLASTSVAISQLSKIVDGSAIKIGDSTYTFAIGTDKVAGDGDVVVNNGAYINDDGTLTEEGLIDALTKLTVAAKDNAMFSVGLDTDSKNLTFTQNASYTPADGVDLTSDKGIAAQLSFAKSRTIASALTLQIGDTSEKYNQLSVNVKACNAEGMGIADIDISTQEGASTAMAAIKDAINYVSDVRGTLGATQNRLDHTINNLSVMQENIQDAESTIRDTDIAEEMMEYTKNSILVQSAQAMLAQANQLPQGVLQLLQ